MEDQWNLAINLWQRIVLEFKNVDITKPNMPGYSLNKDTQ